MLKNDVLVALTSIFVALDTIGVLPMVVAMTSHLNRDEQRKLMNLSVGVAFTVAIAFVAIGQSVFKHLGISIFDFKIAGGIVLMLLGVIDIVGGPDTGKPKSPQTGIVPLAVPLITGPAAFATIILLVGNVGYVITIGALIANYLVTWLILRNINVIERILGKEGSIVMSKIAALLLVAIAVSMIRTGVFDAIRAF